MSHLDRLRAKTPAAQSGGQEKKKEKRMTEFADPGSSLGIDWEGLNGELLLIKVNGVENGIATSFGEKEAVRADVTVVDGKDGGETYADTLIFPRVLIGQLRGQVGKTVLGVLSQGVAKPGQKPPWKLDAASEADRKKAAASLLASADEAPF